MPELKQLRPRPALRPALATLGLAVLRLELPAGPGPGEHGHDVVELAWLARGRLDHRIGGSVCPGGAGSLLVVPQGQVHDYLVAPGGALLWNALIDPERIAAPVLPPPLARHLSALLPAPGAPALLIGGVDLATPFAVLAAEQERREPGWPQAMASALRLVLIAAARALQAGRVQAIAGADPRIEALRRRLDEQPGLTWDLARMAREAGLGTSALVRAFRRHVGCAPAAYLRQARLRRARALVGDGATLAVAARAVGYGDAPALARAFRRSGTGSALA